MSSHPSASHGIPMPCQVGPFWTWLCSGRRSAWASDDYYTCPMQQVGGHTLMARPHHGEALHCQGESHRVGGAQVSASESERCAHPKRGPQTRRQTRAYVSLSLARISLVATPSPGVGAARTRTRPPVSVFDFDSKATPGRRVFIVCCMRETLSLALQ